MIAHGNSLAIQNYLQSSSEYSREPVRLPVWLVGSAPDVRQYMVPGHNLPLVEYHFR